MLQVLYKPYRVPAANTIDIVLLTGAYIIITLGNLLEFNSSGAIDDAAISVGIIMCSIALIYNFLDISYNLGVKRLHVLLNNKYFGLEKYFQRKDSPVEDLDI